MPPRVAFLGTPAVAVPALRALAEAAAVQAVFCNPDRPAGRGRKLEAPPVKGAALDLGLAVHQPSRWKDPETRALWESLNIDLAVVVAYGHILPSWMLDSLRLGAWNLHFSLLPKWRGAAPVNHAILAGDAETGVSLMRITPGLDEGPMLAMSLRAITMEDDAVGLLATLAEDAGALLASHLPALLEGTAVPTPQTGETSFASKLSKEMARLDATRPALELHRRVRALQPWPGAELALEDGILKALAVGAMRATDDKPGTLRWSKDGAWLACGDGRALELLRLQRAGKPAQPALQALQPFGAQGSLELV
ncbi:MAG TPA: methionyl-tRNA formyltransferase [Holophagaceae bacterium]|jgi:methionyl-tRNA formyltransferase|nr:methionyl-tRNA formyltransferase [Holophagaceae bacterium]